MIAGIVLAAGSARRMGSPKQLATISERPMLQHVVDRAAAASLAEIVVVVGYAAHDIEREVELPASGRFVRNPDHASGQASSLAVGLASLGPHVRAALILLGDQPDVRPSAIRAVQERYEDTGGPVVRVRYAGEPGHPVLIDRSLWERVAVEDQDRGAGPALSSHPDWVVWVDRESPPPQEVDTPDDLSRIRDRGLDPPD